MYRRASITDIQFLRSNKLESGYCGVYPKRDRWVAKPYRARYGGTYQTPTDAAAAVAAWWAEKFGDEWVEAFRRRHQCPWQVRRDRELGGYRLFVWEEGRKRAVPPPNPKHITFATRAEAVAYLRIWVRGRYGIFAPVALSRTPPRPFPEIESSWRYTEGAFDATNAKQYHHPEPRTDRDGDGR